MFPFPIATPQGCNIQTFYGTSDAPDEAQMSWTKPVGASHVYMMLIGAGGNGSGGGSGAVTVWYGAAQHVPNNLVVKPAGIGGDTQVSYRGNSLITLLQARGGSSSSAGPASSATAFAASGFFKSTAGQDGIAGNLTPSSTTFLSGGASTSVTANYGYTVTGSNKSGYFQMQPIIVGTGGLDAGSGGIGCGGGSGASVGKGGPGMVLIASW